MKYHIDTILLWDSFRSGSECPLCVIKAKCEADFVDSALGGSVMEPDRRVEVNRLGFCGDHLSLLYAGDNHLGLALMTHTHLREVIAEHDGLVGKLRAELDKKGGRKWLKRRGAPADDTGAGDTPKAGAGLTALTGAIVTRSSTCFVCQRLDTAMERYAHNAVALWQNDQEFQRVFNAGKGFCMPHYAQLLDISRKALNGKKRAAFLRALMDIQAQNLARIERELEWYTLKHDYRNREKPWGDSKDAVERSLGKLRGWRKA